ncbi:hypothetical protein Tco_1511732 [Tanacetum coccineum]
MPNTSNKETPFNLAYDIKAVIPAEIGMPTRRTTQRTNEENDRVHHKQFRAGEFILRKNEVSKTESTGKLGPKWKGPYEVIEAYGTGAYKLISMDGKEVQRTWHSSNLWKYYM